MRTRTIVAGLTLALAASTAAGGCQIIAELNTLQVIGTGGGMSGATSTSGTTSSGAPCTPGTACGATCEGSTVTPPGSCGPKGACSSQPTPCMDGFACVAGGTTCNSTCTEDSQCAAGHVCAPAGPNGMPASQCLACGGYPMGMCMAGVDGGCASSCDGATCVTTCGAGTSCAGTSQAPLVVDATKAPARLVCDSTCLGSTILCKGVFPCEIDCPMGSGGPTCGSATTSGPGTTIECGGGPCTLACDMMGCKGVTLQCADNACTGTYYTMGTMPAPIVKECGNSCACNVGEADAGP